MLTPRQKAIIVGLVMSDEAYITNEDPQKLLQIMIKPHSVPLRFISWIKSELEGLSWQLPEIQEFLQKAKHKVLTHNYEDWLYKMSPVAIATWIMAKHLKDGFSDIDLLSLPLQDNILGHEVCAMFRKNWGINLIKMVSDKNYSLYPAEEEDLINLWILVKSTILEGSPELAPIIDSKYKRTRKQVYLSGGQERSEDGGIGWRATVSPILFRLGYDICNPAYDQGWMDEFGVNLKKLKEKDFNRYCQVGQTMIKYDRRQVLKSDGVLVYWNQAAEMGAGTKSEITWTNDFSLPCVLVTDHEYVKADLPIWTLGGVRNPENIVLRKDFDTAIQLLHEAINENTISRTCR